MKHTKGEWELTFSANKPKGVRNKDGYICFLPKPSHYPGQDNRYERELEKCKANAELIVEAGNVTNETGYTPRQLAEQKAELLEALNTVFDLIDRGVLVRDISKDHDFGYFTKQGIEISNAMILVNEAIKKATK